MEWIERHKITSLEGTHPLHTMGPSIHPRDREDHAVKVIVDRATGRDLSISQSFIISSRSSTIPDPSLCSRVLVTMLLISQKITNLTVQLLSYVHSKFIRSFDRDLSSFDKSKIEFHTFRRGENFKKRSKRLRARVLAKERQIVPANSGKNFP